MKLEFESNTASLPLIDQSNVDEMISDSNSPEVTKLLRDGIEAAQKGNRAEARTYLLRVTEADAKNENAWLWLASISEYPEELLVFLRNVLSINPKNERAIEWEKATETLMAKTFVQRGIDASKNDQKDFAKQCFLQAIVHDSKSELAWLWLSSVCDSPEEKTSHLQKVLSINPHNENAISSLKSAKHQMAKALLPKANKVALSGKREEAQKLLDEIVNDAPDFEDAWMLKAHLAESFEDKIAYFEQVLEVNSENQVAKANLESLRMFVGEAQSDESNGVIDLQAVESEQMENFVEDSKEEVEVVDATDDLVSVEDVKEEVENKNSEDEDVAKLNNGNTGELELELQDEEVSVQETLEVEVDAEVDAKLEAETKAEQNDLSEEVSAKTKIEEVQLNSQVQEVESVVEHSELAPVYEEVKEEDEVLYSNESQPIHESLQKVEKLAEVHNTPQVMSEETHSYEPETQVEDNNKEEAIEELVSNESDAESVESKPDVISEESASYEIESTEVEHENVSEETISSDSSSEIIDAKETSTIDPLELEEKVSDDNLVTETKPEEFVESESIDVVEDEQAEETKVCGFCEAENEQQVFVCTSCKSVLSLSDIEMILFQENADKKAIQDALVKLEEDKTSVGVSNQELKLMGVGYINLKDYRKGLRYLKEVARQDQNDVVFSSQVDALAIRISEIEKQEKQKEAQPKSKKILIVDDSPTVRKLISGKLEKCGHVAISAVDGMDALAKINEVIPDLILLDITMPRMDGYQVCKLIRGNEATKEVPIVMISGKDGFFDKVRGRMAGTDNYITKPFGPETLMMTVNQYIS